MFVGNRTLSKSRCGNILYFFVEAVVSNLGAICFALPCSGQYELLLMSKYSFPDNIYLLNVSSNRNTRKRCEISSKITIKAPERQCCFSVSIVNFEHISHLFLVLTLNK